MLFLRSRERAKAMKDHDYTCAACGARQSRAKGNEVFVEVHHSKGIDWSGLIDLIRERLLSGELVVLCSSCHKTEEDKIKTLAENR